MLIPSILDNVVEHCPAGISPVCDVLLAVSQIPDKPGIHSAKGKLALFGLLTCSLHVVEYPRDLGSRKRGINPQAGLLPNRIVCAIVRKPSAQRSTSAILPDNRVVDRLPRLA